MRTFRFRFRGFSLKKHVFRVTKWVSGRPGNRSESHACPPWKLLTWGRFLKTKLVCTGKSNYVPLGSKHGVMDDDDRRGTVPKGHMAVYVGREGGGNGDVRRVFVPVVYFNHPLFGELLREAEEEYGFCQQGGFTIPCRVSEFERVRTRIDAVCHGAGGGGMRRRICWRKRG